MMTGTARFVRTAACLCLFAVLAVGGVGCESTGAKGPGNAGRAGPRMKPIEYAEFAAEYNKRVERLERLWSRATVVIDGTDAEGSPLREQAEGHLQIERPYNVALTLGKLGETNLYLGSNAESYWWFDMIDGSAKQAWRGRHAFFTAEKAGELGLPVHPLDFTTLLGVLPLPETGGAVVRPIVRGEPSDVLLAEVPTAMGTVWLWVDQRSMEPARISILGRDRVPVLTSDLSRYTTVEVEDDRAARTRVASRMVVRVRGLDGEVRLTLNDPTNKPIKPVVFDVDRLLRAYRISEVNDLDADETGAESAAADPTE